MEKLLTQVKVGARNKEWISSKIKKSSLLSFKLILILNFRFHFYDGKQNIRQFCIRVILRIRQTEGSVLKTSTECLNVGYKEVGTLDIIEYIVLSLNFNKETLQQLVSFWVVCNFKHNNYFYSKGQETCYLKYRIISNC